jgi:microsomal dipeptidase-like Zn-dependent dipeptidase
MFQGGVTRRPASDLGDLVDALLAEGFTDAEVLGILGDNYQRLAC